jgi:hypothetical protein
MRDRGSREGMPFTFMQQQHLVALGVAKQLGVAEKAAQFDQHHVSTSFVPIVVHVIEAEDVIALDSELLATWKPPVGATDAYVLLVEDHPLAVVKRCPTGTRIDELAAQALWTVRAKWETGGLLTRHAWCTHCGRHFQDRRPGYHEEIVQFCPAHRNTRSKHLPLRRECVAPDCDRWFRPSKGNRIYCGNACRSAAQTGLARTT